MTPKPLLAKSNLKQKPTPAPHMTTVSPNSCRLSQVKQILLTFPGPSMFLFIPGHWVLVSIWPDLISGSSAKVLDLMAALNNSHPGALNIHAQMVPLQQKHCTFCICLYKVTIYNTAVLGHPWALRKGWPWSPTCRGAPPNPLFLPHFCGQHIYRRGGCHCDRWHGNAARSRLKAVL